MANIFFGRAGVEDFTLPGGEVVHLPICYHDFENIGAAFLGSAPRVRELIPGDTLRPVQLAPGKAILHLMALEYRHLTESGGRERMPYNEFMIGVPVLHAPAVNPPALPLFLPGRFPTFGIYVHRLPVTTAESRDAGIQIWGLPKIVAEINFTESEGLRRCRVSAEGREVLTLEVNKVPTHMQGSADRLYGIRDGRLRRCVFEQRGQVGIARFRGGASYTLGDHPLSEELRRIHLGHIGVERSYATRLQGLLHAPQEYRDGAWVERFSAVPDDGRAASRIPA